MNVEKFDLKKDQPVARENDFGTKFGYYKETYTDGKELRVRFSGSKNKSTGMFSGTMDEVRPATKEEIAENNL